MSEMAQQARTAMKAKAQRMGGGGEPDPVPGCTSWTPPEPLHGDIQTGERPISRRQYKAGGSVAGSAAAPNAGRSARKSGGALTANSLINRDVKDANDERDGVKHVGGFARGGVPGGMGGRPAPSGNPGAGRPIPAWATGALQGGPSMPQAGFQRGFAPPASGMAPRMARKDGGRAGKGKMNVNIVIATAPPQDAGATTPPPAPPPGPPPVPVGAMPPKAPPMTPPSVPMPGAPPPIMPPPMPGPVAMRKAGGRIANTDDLDAGAGGALGRLEKIKLQKAAK